MGETSRGVRWRTECQGSDPKTLTKTKVKSQYCLLSDSRFGKFLKHVGTVQDNVGHMFFLVLARKNSLKATLLDEGEPEMVQQILPSTLEPALRRRRRKNFRKKGCVVTFFGSLGRISSPTNLLTNQGPFFHCSGALTRLAQPLDGDIFIEAFPGSVDTLRELILMRRMRTPWNPKANQFKMDGNGDFQPFPI